MTCGGGGGGKFANRFFTCPSRLFGPPGSAQYRVSISPCRCRWIALRNVLKSYSHVENNEQWLLLLDSGNGWRRRKYLFGEYFANYSYSKLPIRETAEILPPNIESFPCARRRRRPVNDRIGARSGTPHCPPTPDSSPRHAASGALFHSGR